MVKAFLAAALLALLTASPALPAVTVREMIGDPRHWPPPCAHRVCVLTGLGGLVEVWERHVRKHRGFRFVVSGTCASACLIAAHLADRLGEQVLVMPGARLIPHKPTKTIWR